MRTSYSTTTTGVAVASRLARTTGEGVSTCVSLKERRNRQSLLGRAGHYCSIVVVCLCESLWEDCGKAMTAGKRKYDRFGTAPSVICPWSIMEHQCSIEASEMEKCQDEHPRRARQITARMLILA
ncbi:uncharacterized protein HMPREF1120_00764 [Exophiala dermatitidis NIH/UT8656]|uniref:Uncharacterized protein n=1 Tax=Exophiala dermatitidis (strain ATCC 34100 / CBS 525.76 / NIH/UT8656) TaxID=858893 RepID=H6BKB9_EXODN|nr:uncharacterized protein HMPREF1120_00764 [Exophiala dermatitidis NIH/UT8656]EHY52553.1 hypothetical protein HMPREF1120_00764 [Exophiala dermatitidis NIH/UT8656]